MKPKLILIGLALIGTVLFTGCADQTTAVDPQTGQMATNYVPNHFVTQGATAVNVVTPFVPAPWNGVVIAATSLSTIIAGAIAAYQNKRKRDHATMLNATIAAIEQANNPQLKANVQTLAAAAGVQGKLDPIVQQITAVLPGSK